MGIFDFLSELSSSFITEVDAESPTRGGASTQSPASGTDEESSAEQEVNEEDAKDEDEGEKPQGHKPSSKDDGDEEEEEGAEEEEEDDDEPVDIMPKIEEECKQSKQCAPLKHHYDECAERVTKQIEDDGKASEDCVEEFFHLMHCANQCAAPKLFSQLH